MSKTTEHLLQIAALVVILYFGWVWIEKAILLPYQLHDRAVQAEQALAKCQAPK
jgi:uncharacterized membrane protein